MVGVFMIYYLIKQKPSFIMMYINENLLKLHHSYDNWYLIKINKLTENQEKKLKEVGWAFYTS